MLKTALLRPLSMLTLLTLLAGGAARAELPEPVAALLQTAHMPPEAIGVLVLRGDQILVSHGAGQPMQPASTIKVLTTMTALEQLGPVFRGRTELRSSAALDKGVLQGDLYLRGGADADFNEDVLRHMLQTLRNQGIRKIKGDIVFDRQLFQPTRLDLGIPPFDEAPEAYYNVIPDALLMGTNLLHIDLASSDSQLKLVMTPAMDKVTIKSDMSLTDEPCDKWQNGWKTPEAVHKGGKLSVVLHGTYPKNCVKANSISVLDRQDYLEHLFRTTWNQLGGSFSGAMREAAAPADSKILAAHVSRVLPEVMRDTNKQSDNTLARLLFLSLGSLETDPVLGSRALPAADATTAARAEQTIRGWMQRHQIDDQGLVLENGSGLSRSERITPTQLAGVLKAAQQSLWAPEFLTSLPIAAVDGTLKRRLKDSPAGMRARMKTGTLSGVIGLAGYVPDANNQVCIVVVLINSPLSGNGVGRGILDALVDWVARSGAVAKETVKE